MTNPNLDANFFDSNDFDMNNSDSSSIYTVHTKTHSDHVYAYSGQNYGDRESVVLHALNELARRNQLVSVKRHLANRNVRILLPKVPTTATATGTNSSSECCNRSNFIFSNDNESSSSQSPRSKYDNNNNNNNKRTAAAYDSNDNGDSSSLTTNEGEEEDFIENDYHHFNNSNSSNDEEAFVVNRNRVNQRQFHNQNYQTFLYHFNKIAMGCYLKLMRASKSFWSAYSVDEKMADETNFYVLKTPKMATASASKSSSNCKCNASAEAECNQTLQDPEFVSNYVDLMVRMHKKAISKLYKTLNTQTIRVHFNHNNQQRRQQQQADRLNGGSDGSDSGGQFSSSNNNSSTNPTSARGGGKAKDSGCHVFRSFRVIGLRQGRQAGKSTNHNVRFSNSSCSNRTSNPSAAGESSKLNQLLASTQFQEVVDIRSSFDIKQFQNKAGYDCFIECEMNYYHVGGKQQHPAQVQASQRCDRKTDYKLYASTKGCCGHAAPNSSENLIYANRRGSCAVHNRSQEFPLNDLIENALRSRPKNHAARIRLAESLYADKTAASSRQQQQYQHQNSFGLLGQDEDEGVDLDDRIIGRRRPNESSWVDCLNRNLNNCNNMANRFTDFDLHNLSARHHHHNHNHNQQHHRRQQQQQQQHQARPESLMKKRMNFLVT